MSEKDKKHIQRKPGGVPTPPQGGPVQDPAQQTAQFIRFEGPIPAPQILAGYDQIEPGTAKRIIGWAEAEGIHRRMLERREQTWHHSAALLALAATTVITLVALVGSFWLVLHDKEIAGFTTFVTAVAGLVIAIRTGRKKE